MQAAGLKCSFCGAPVPTHASTSGADDRSIRRRPCIQRSRLRPVVALHPSKPLDAQVDPARSQAPKRTDCTTSSLPRQPESRRRHPTRRGPAREGHPRRRESAKGIPLSIAHDCLAHREPSRRRRPDVPRAQQEPKAGAGTAAAPRPRMCRARCRRTPRKSRPAPARDALSTTSPCHSWTSSPRTPRVTMVWTLGRLAKACHTGPRPTPIRPASLRPRGRSSDASARSPCAAASPSPRHRPPCSPPTGRSRA